MIAGLIVAIPMAQQIKTVIQTFQLARIMCGSLDVVTKQTIFQSQHASSTQTLHMFTLIFLPRIKNTFSRCKWQHLQLTTRGKLRYCFTVSLSQFAQSADEFAAVDIGFIRFNIFCEHDSFALWLTVLDRTVCIMSV